MKRSRSVLGSTTDRPRTTLISRIPVRTSNPDVRPASQRSVGSPKQNGSRIPRPSVPRASVALEPSVLGSVSMDLTSVASVSKSTSGYVRRVRTRACAWVHLQDNDANTASSISNLNSIVMSSESNESVQVCRAWL
jgi:hypothetical protein